MPNGTCRSTRRSTWKPKRRPIVCRPTISSAPTKPSPPSARRSSRVTDLAWPFFEERHRELARELESWCRDNLTGRYAEDIDSECRALVRELGAAGLLKLCVANGAHKPDVRSLSIGGIADVYVTFARTGEGEGARGLSAFIVPADAVTVAERIEVIAPHPLARLTYADVHIPADALIGEPGEGFRIGMETLNLFRVTVGAAALGFARRALDEEIGRAHV